MSVTPEIPSTRKPIEDKNPLRIKNEHPLAQYFENDRRWDTLPQYFKTRVLETAIGVHSLTNDQVVQKAKELDQEIPISPYLKTLAEHGGTLMLHYDAMADVFSTQSLLDEKEYEKLPARITQIRLADRTMGREIEKEFGWDAKNGFGQFANEAQIAINLCTEAIRDIPPPNL